MALWSILLFSHMYLLLKFKGGGVDYDFESLEIVFPVGSTNASFDIIINDDDIFEDDETFNISIASITNNHIVGIPGVATVTIVDITGKYLIICFMC